MKAKLSMVLNISFALILLSCMMKPRNLNYVSHSKEPKIGDMVKNNNPSCKHFESVGKVVDIKSLNNDMGKTITYKVANDGSTYCKGQLLNKTMDQLTAMK